MTVRRIKKPQANGKTIFKWIADVDFLHPDGRRERIRKTPKAQTRVDAQRLEREIRAKLEAPKTTEEAIKEIPTFASFWAEFWKNHVRINNKPSEQHAKRGIMEHHLLPAFGQLRLNEITPKRIEAYKALKLNGEPGYAPKTINNHLAVLKTVLHTAKQWHELDVVPFFRDLKLPERRTPFFDFAEARLLVAHSDGIWKTMIVVALNTGLRIGEMLALEWDDIHVDSGRLMVNRSDWYGIIGLPKGGRGREIPLNPAASAKILRHSSRCPKPLSTHGPVHICRCPMRRRT